MADSDNLMNFDNYGKWSGRSLTGPAVHAPANVKAIVISTYRIEWLNMSDLDNDFYAKNHMIATLVFAQDEWINGHVYKSARLSMEQGPLKVTPDVNEVRSSVIP